MNTAEGKIIAMVNKDLWVVQTSPAQSVFRILLAVFLGLAGVGHLSVLRQEFLAQVPTWMPIDSDLVVVFSGVVEIVLGVGLIILPI